jgi:ATP-dependent Clp protease ATP-binding subunit ClpA/CheY-like chemotaxis protein
MRFVVMPSQTGTEASSPQSGAGERLAALLASKVVGQPTALQTILPGIHLHRSGLAPEDRPVGAFLLLGPTGTGKTRTVEAIAEVLHGSARSVLRIDCGEFQSDHEIAKLIGAPPGYVGHFESKPRLSAENLDKVRSEGSDLALILFDEIEKAAPAMAPLLLSILDRATLTLGNGEEVDFTRTLIFFTSNLGAREMMEEIRPHLGFDTGEARSPAELRARLEGISRRAAEKHFPPEFLNRIDAIVTYRPLDAASLVAILEHHILELQRHVHTRLGRRSFEIEVAPAARYFMIDRGTSLAYGARELRRVIHQHLTQPVAEMVANGRIEPHSVVTIDLDESGEGFHFTVTSSPDVEVAPATCTALVVDDSEELLRWIDRVVSDRGCTVLTARSAAEARTKAHEQAVDVAVVDSVLEDGEGVYLARELRTANPELKTVIMSAVELDDEERVVCDTNGFVVLPKPFLSGELIAALEAQGVSVARVRAKGA